MTQLDHVRFFNAGYCLQLRCLAEGRGRGVTRFHAVFVHLRHPTQGDLLIDTGYSPAFLEATRPVPQRLYRWLTPAHLPEGGDAAAVLAVHGLDPQAVTTIFVSHFHADHIGGLRAFPRTRFVYVGDALAALGSLGTYAHLRHAYLPSLLPVDFEARGTAVQLSDFAAGSGALEGLQVLDFFQDGSVVMVHLPGHAVGQVGYALNLAPRPLLYVVDACWSVDALMGSRPLPALSRRVQHDFAAYDATQDALRRVARRERHLLLACHCPHTQVHVENTSR